MNLEITDLNVWYGARHVLTDLTVTVGPGITLVTGRNGAGKTTLLKTIYGIVQPSSGSVRLNGRNILGLSPKKLRALGLGYMPQGGQVFARMDCLQNLLMAAGDDNTRAVHSRIDALSCYFPAIAGRLGQNAGTLSGGERQMLALWMALMPSPKLLLLDEPLAALSDSSVHAFADIIEAVLLNNDTQAVIVEHRCRYIAPLVTAAVDIGQCCEPA